MEHHPLTDEDEALIDAARDVVEEQYVHNRHYVGSAVRTTDGEIYAAVHIEANVSRATVCAEPIVMGKAVSEGAHDIETIVSVRHPGPEEESTEIPVVSPCGVCRELISDMGHDIKVVYAADGDVMKTRAVDLLPGKYVRSYRKQYFDE